MLLYSSAAREQFFEFISIEHPDDFQRVAAFLKNNLTRGTSSTADSDMVLIIMRLFPFFLASKAYSNWSACQLGFPELVEAEGLDELFSHITVPDLSKLQKVLSATLIHLPSCITLVRCDPWFRIFLDVVETLPLGVYLTLPDEKRGFPVVYANPFLVAATGYSRESMIGRPASFLVKDGLQGALEEAGELFVAYCKSTPFAKTVTTYRRDESSVRSYVMSKPIYDMYPHFRFIVSVQTEDFSEQNLHQIASFLSIVPNLIYEEV